MTQLNITLDSTNIQDIIDQSGATDLAKQMLTLLFNQLMENNVMSTFRLRATLDLKNALLNEMVTMRGLIQLE